MIKVWINRNKTGGHNNLYLEIDELGFKKEADTYYFALDNLFMEGDESTLKVSLNLKQLLESWISSVNSLRKGETVYLPFDFSDQYIGCLKVDTTKDNEIVLNYGYTTKHQGYGFNPSQSNSFKLQEGDYKPVTESCMITKTAFASDIGTSIKDVMATATVDEN